MVVMTQNWVGYFHAVLDFRTGLMAERTIPQSSARLNSA
jgi:hypothetical protein